MDTDSRIKHLPGYELNTVANVRVSSADLSAATGDLTWTAAVRIADVLKAAGVKTANPRGYAERAGVRVFQVNRASTFVRASDARTVVAASGQSWRTVALLSLFERLLENAEHALEGRAQIDARTLALGEFPAPSSTAVLPWPLQSNLTTTWAGPAVPPVGETTLPYLAHLAMDQEPLTSADVFEDEALRQARVNETNRIVEEGRVARSEFGAARKAAEDIVEIASGEVSTLKIFSNAVGLSGNVRLGKLTGRTPFFVGSVQQAIQVAQAALKTAEAAAERQAQKATSDPAARVEQLLREIHLRGDQVQINQNRSIDHAALAAGRPCDMGFSLTVNTGPLNLLVTCVPGTDTTGILVAALEAVAAFQPRPEPTTFSC